MDHHDDLERYESTEARDLVRLFSALRPPPAEHAPAHFRAQVLAQVAQRQARHSWFAWLKQGGTSPWIAALATGLILSVGLNTWLGYQVLEWRKQGTALAPAENSAAAPSQGEATTQGREPEGSVFTFRGGGPLGTPQHPEAATLPSEAELVRALTELAAQHNRAGQYKRSIAAASAALTLDGNAALAYLYRGMAYNGMGNRAQAIQDVRHAARLGEAQAHDVLQAWGVD